MLSFNEIQPVEGFSLYKENFYKYYSLYPRFFAGLILFGALVLAVKPADLSFCGIFDSFAALASFNSFESSKTFKAAFALLLNFFFGCDILSLLFLFGLSALP